ncbi:MAG: 4Fe-4S dicluster domain-containing protein [Clostridia bacterium]|nr:4Fe-4S dicluster domain-containing protein [Clostridia bacterium]
MQIVDSVKNCNGCGACVVACKYQCLKMHDRNDEKAASVLASRDFVKKDTKKMVPVRDENGCQKCNACVLFCPLFNPVELPEFEQFYQYEEAFESRDLPAHYRQVMRSVRSGARTEFVATLCQIAAVKSLLGDKIPENLILRPMYCDEWRRENDPICKDCRFYEGK